MQRTCKYCGAELIGTANGRKYCSMLCRRAAERIKKRKPEQPVEIKCAHCGKAFSRRNGYQKYCSEECRAQAYSQLQKVEPKKPTKPKLEVAPKKTLADWCREANECNLDYGNYRALIESGKTFDELKANADSRQFPAHSHLRKGMKHP